MTAAVFVGSEYDRGFRDGQEARRRDDAWREYERGYRDGYGSHPPVWPVMPVNPYAPTWGDPIIRHEYTLICSN